MDRLDRPCKEGRALIEEHSTESHKQFFKSFCLFTTILTDFPDVDFMLKHCESHSVSLDELLPKQTCRVSLRLVSKYKTTHRPVSDHLLLRNNGVKTGFVGWAGQNTSPSLLVLSFLIWSSYKSVKVKQLSVSMFSVNHQRWGKSTRQHNSGWRHDWKLFHNITVSFHSISITSD